jgi:hypothetical protein
LWSPPHQYRFDHQATTCSAPAKQSQINILQSRLKVEQQ